MPKFRKKPVVIEAVQWTGSNYQDVVEFVTGDPYHELGREGSGLLIQTLEDGPGGEAKHYASPGDWIIKGVNGEFYPCKPGIFVKTYDQVQELQTKQYDDVTRIITDPRYVQIPEGLWPAPEDPAEG